MKFTRLLLVTGIALFLLPYGLDAQKADSTLSHKVYKVNPYISGGIGVLGLVTNVLGLPGIIDKDTIASIDILNLDENKVGRFNRIALRQRLDRKEQAGETSDYIMYSSAVMPIFLVLDKKIRKDFLNIGLIYFQTLAISSNIYTHSPLGPRYIESYRPIVYYQDLPINERNGGTQRNSFFSGHVSTTATGTFFTAKVLCDYHPEWGYEKVLAYSLASIPPAVVGVLRVKAIKHFPSDVVVGAAIGAGMGLLMPTLHKKWQQKAMLSATFTPEFKGGGLLVKF
jgi:membrane-associated phospholipid phosphatase